MPTTTNYLSKEIAAERLNLSVRRVLELAGQNKLRHTKIHNEETGRKQVVIAEADVEAMRGARETVAAPAAAATTELAIRPPDAPPAPHKLWLTLDQAEDCSGLPASVIASLIQAGRLPALDVGVRPGGRWRVKKADLEAMPGIYFGPSGR